MPAGSVSIILSTYNQPDWLRKVLWGYLLQDWQAFEVVIADDGSGPETARVVEGMQRRAPFAVKHVWHEDEGFRKSAILNKAIRFAEGDYLIFSDGDCIPRRDFVTTHRTAAERGCFVSGGYCRLPLELSQRIQPEDIESGCAFEFHWLKEQGLGGLSGRLKVGLPRAVSSLADAVTTTKATWNGCNASGWKADLLSVNGHDETMCYGGQDRELGERLLNLGLRAKQFRHRAALLHLDHSRAYRTEEGIERNLAIRTRTRERRATWTPAGIIQSPLAMPFCV